MMGSGKRSDDAATLTTSAAAEAVRVSWDGLAEPVPLHKPIPLGALFAMLLLTCLTFGLILPVLAWDFFRRANAVGRDGIHTHVGVLAWRDLEDLVVHTAHTSRRGRITATVHLARLRFASRTIDIGPWGAPDPELVLRALSAGAGRAIDVPRPSGNVRG